MNLPISANPPVCTPDSDPPGGAITAGGGAARSGIAALLERIRAGDRAAAGEFIERYGPIIRRRVSGKLGAAMRRLFDSQEVLSTVARRLDQYVFSHQVQAADETQFWALIFRMVDAAYVDKVRVFRRLRETEGEDSPFAALCLARLSDAAGSAPDAPEVELSALFESLASPVDRQILSLWLTGQRLDAIARLLAMTPTAARQRWLAIRERLRVRLEGGMD